MSKLILTKKDVSKVENCALNTQQLDFILQGTPKSAIRERPAKGGGTWKYVSGTYVRKVLNMAFGFDWSFEIKDYQYDIAVGQAFVQGRLTVNTNGKTITKEQFGRQEIKFKTAYENGKKVRTNIPLDIGNDLKGAATDALKKCSADFGIAMDVYAPEEFTAVSIADDNEADQQFLEITDLYKTVKNLSDLDRKMIDKVLDNDITEKYGKVIELLKAHQ